MVHSLLKPSLIYDEDQIIMEQDIGIDVDIYELEIYHKVIQVVIGRESKKYIHRGILSYSIYGIVKNIIKTRLGIIEIETKNFSIYDVKNKTPDFSQHIPLLFSFVNSIYIDKLKPELKEIEQLDEIFDIDSSKKNDDEESNDVAIDKGELDIFTKVPYREIKLQEESEITTKLIRKKYVEETTNNWIQKFMKNPNYAIEYNSGSGDCFFYVIIQAFNQIGMETTVNKLRSLLSNEATKDIYEENKKIYDEIKDNQKIITIRLKEEKENLKQSTIYLENIGIELKKLSSQELKEAFIKKNKVIINKNTKINETSKENIKNLNEELKTDKENEDLIDPYIKNINSYFNEVVYKNEDPYFDEKIDFYEKEVLNAYENGKYENECC